MQHLFDHSLAPQQAYALLRVVEQELRRKYPHAAIETEWHDANKSCAFKFTVIETTVSGAVSVARFKKINIDVFVPVIFKPWVPLAKKMIQREIDRWCKQAKEGKIL